MDLLERNSNSKGREPTKKPGGEGKPVHLVLVGEVANGLTLQSVKVNC